STYGEATLIPTPEDAPFPVQTSLYAASKVAGETLISSYAEGGQIDEAYIFRFVSILGERYTHGHVFDFYQGPNVEQGKKSLAISVTLQPADKTLDEASLNLPGINQGVQA
ncbi:MAG: NAD-dependent epimerase/dehydratase family protein, partial [Chloroflexi bacterium]|nr:NAD-dependent epimerase/dehydratase family protein [Chloroflexota bacterium]